MSPELLKLVTNHELIAINKDSLGVQGHKLMSYSAPNVSVPIVEPVRVPQLHVSVPCLLLSLHHLLRDAVLDGE